MKYGLLITALLFAFSAQATCPAADRVLTQSGKEAAARIYEKCALNKNDTDSQLFLARFYKDKKDVKNALLYYTLAANAGHAEAQNEYASYLIFLDQKEKTRNDIITFKKRLNTLSSADNPILFLSPHALWIIATMPESDKWFAASTRLTYVPAKENLTRYGKNRSEKQRIEALNEVENWKNIQIKAAAKQLLSDEEYARFIQTVYPEKGIPNAYEKQRALNALKQQTIQYKQQHNE